MFVYLASNFMKRDAISFPSGFYLFQIRQLKLNKYY